MNLPNKIGVIFLDSVVQDGNGDAASSDALSPRVRHAHVEAVAAVQVPHLVPQRIRKAHARRDAEDA